MATVGRATAPLAKPTVMYSIESFAELKDMRKAINPVRDRNRYDSPTQRPKAYHPCDGGMVLEVRRRGSTVVSQQGVKAFQMTGN